MTMKVMLIRCWIFQHNVAYVHVSWVDGNTHTTRRVVGRLETHRIVEQLKQHFKNHKLASTIHKQHTFQTQ